MLVFFKMDANTFLCNDFDSILLAFVSFLNKCLMKVQIKEKKWLSINFDCYFQAQRHTHWPKRHQRSYTQGSRHRGQVGRKSRSQSAICCCCQVLASSSPELQRRFFNIVSWERHKRISSFCYFRLVFRFLRIIFNKDYYEKKGLQHYTSPSSLLLR